jgi:hypothetical protein
MKKSLENIMVGILAAFAFIALISIFIGIGFADSESILPTMIFTGGGFATLGLCYLFGKAVF